MFQRPLSLIVYIAENHCEAEVWNFVQRQSRQGEVEILYTVETLHNRLRHNGKKDMIAVLMITSRSELEKIVRFSDLLCDHKIILVLPDRSPQIVSAGHALYPRYIGYHGGDLQDVDWVLQKMVERDKTRSEMPTKMTQKTSQERDNKWPNQRNCHRERRTRLPRSTTPG